MRSLALVGLVFLSLNVHAVPPVLAAPVLPAQSDPSLARRYCAEGYHCQDVHVQLCIKKPRGRNIWNLTRKDARLRRGVSTRDCTEYAVGIVFTLQYNGKQAVVVGRSRQCRVQVQHGVSVVVEKCYSVVQKNAHKQFIDVVSGARVCVRSMGFRGRGCHQDYAINVYAYPNGRLVGETFVGFKIHVPNL